MDQTRVKLALIDGTEHEAVTTTYACLADKVAFERAFNVPFAAMAGAQGMFDDEGAPVAGADLTAAPRSEWAAFLIYRVAQRDMPAVAGWSFERFCTEVVDTEVAAVEAGPMDPTSEGPSAS
jgi:hypothetical protein